MTLSGHVGTLPLADLLHSAATSRRSCRILVTGRLVEGELLLETGEVVHGRYGDLLGVEAVYAMLADTEAWFSVEPLAPDRPVPQTIAAPWRYLLLEGVRRLDEGTLRRPTPGLAAMPAPLAPTPPEPPAPVSIWQPRLGRRLRVPTLPSRTEATAALRALWTRLAGTGPGRIVLLGGLALFALVTSAVVTSRMLERRQVPSPRPPTAAAPPPPSAASWAPAPAPLADRPAALLAGDAPASPMPRLSFSPTILLRLTISETGLVEQAWPFDPRPDMALYEAAALKAVRRYRFSPARRDGRPVVAHLSWPVSFAPGPGAAPRRRRIVVKGAEVTSAGFGPAAAKAYEAGHPGIDVVWQRLSSEAAIAALLDGSADLAVTTRPFSAADVRDARRLGIALSEVALGHDALTVIVHPDSPLERVPVTALARLYRGELSTFAALGGGSGRARPLIAGPYSDDRRALALLDAAPRRKALRLGARVREFDRPEEIVRAVARQKSAIALVSRALVDESVRALPIVVSGETLAPDAATLREGLYPLRRTLYALTRNPPSAETAGLVRFLTSDDGRALTRTWGFEPPDGPRPSEAPGQPAWLSGVSPAEPDAARITFSSGTSRLDARAQRALTRLARLAKKRRKALLVVAHSDAAATPTRALRESRRRAQSVLRFLEKKSVPRAQVELRARGARVPVDTNRTLAGRRRNRRVDVYLVDPR